MEDLKPPASVNKGCYDVIQLRFCDVTELHYLRMLSVDLINLLRSPHKVVKLLSSTSVMQQLIEDKLVKLLLNVCNL